MQTRTEGALTLTGCGLVVCMAPRLTWLVTEKPMPTLISGVIAVIVVFCVAKAVTPDKAIRET